MKKSQKKSLLKEQGIAKKISSLKDEDFEDVDDDEIESVEEVSKEELLEEELLTISSDMGVDEPIKMYLREIGQIPLLNHKEEFDYAVTIGLGFCLPVCFLSFFFFFSFDVIPKIGRASCRERVSSPV